MSLTAHPDYNTRIIPGAARDLLSADPAAFAELGEMFQAASDFLVTHGWWQGEFGGLEEGEFCPACLLGAIDVANTTLPIQAWYSEGNRRAAAIDILEGILTRDGHRNDQLAPWNDSAGRSVVEVHNLLAEGVSLLRSDEFDEFVEAFQ